MDPAVFVKDIPVKRMKAKAVVVGPDCSFGHKGAGNVELQDFKQGTGFSALCDRKGKRITEEISAVPISGKNFPGEMWQRANELLGEPYAIHGIVVHGNHIGGPRLGFSHSKYYSTGK